MQTSAHLCPVAVPYMALATSQHPPTVWCQGPMQPAQGRHQLKIAVSSAPFLSQSGRQRRPAH